ASGIPVIGSAFDSIMNVVEKYECGLCVNPLDINEIRKAIQFLVDNPEEAKRMGINGRRVVKEKMNWEVHSDVLLNAYGKLMEKRNG
ncbi:MAG: glycosyltransferase, partial [Clostridiales bacterium]|nr:glycosyltransferase [Clostridiales bacterium]